MMKYLLFTTLFILAQVSVCAQSSYDLSGLQGLKDDKGNVFFEISGYEIKVTSFTGKIEDIVAADSLKMRFSLGTILANYSDPEISVANRIIEAEFEVVDNPDEKQNRILYLIQRDGECVFAMFFQTYNQRDVSLEQVIVDAYIKDGLQQYVSDDWNAKEIDFAGQIIALEYACVYKSPHAVRSGKAELMWSEFPSYESALLDINNRIRLRNSQDVLVLLEGEVEVLFGDVPTVAYRIVCQQKNGVYKNEKTAYYYIVHDADGRFLGTVLSNPVNAADDYKLAPLLQQFFSITKLPEVTTESDDLNREEPIAYFDRKTTISVLAGSWLPIGSLSKVYKVAPAVGLIVGFPVGKNVFIDGGFHLALPLDRDQFIYYRDKEAFDTKVEFMGDFVLRARYKKKLTRDISLYPYLGMGVSLVQTDLKKESFDDDEPDEYSSIAAPDVHVGGSITYQKFGAFLEYHYAPYSVGNKVQGSFGKSFLSLGLTFQFSVD